MPVAKTLWRAQKVSYRDCTQHLALGIQWALSKCVSNCWLMDQKFKERAQQRRGRPRERLARERGGRALQSREAPASLRRARGAAPRGATGTRPRSPQPGLAEGGGGGRGLLLPPAAESRRPAVPCLSRNAAARLSGAPGGPLPPPVPTQDSQPPDPRPIRTTQARPSTMEVISIKKHQDGKGKTETLSFGSSHAAGGDR